MLTENDSFFIREIQPSDNAILAKIIRDIFEEFNAPKTGTVYSDPSTDQLFELFEAEERAFFLVVELNQKVVGCCGIFPTKNLPEGYAELVKFYLSPAARGKGIGKALFTETINSAKKMDYHFLYIESAPLFSDALKIYEKYGFEYIDHPLGNSGHDSCDIWMIKSLTNP